MRFPLLLAFVVGLFSSLVAQDLRKEVEVESYGDAFYVLATGEDGLVLFNEADTSSKRLGEKIWEFTKFTSEFDQIWQRSITVRNRLVYERHYWDNTFLHVLLLDERNRNKRKFTIVSLNVETSELTKTDGVIPFNIKVNDFSVIRNYAYVGGETQMGKIESYGRSAAAAFVIPLFFGIMEHNQKMVLTRVDIDAGKTETLPFDYKSESYVTSFSPRETKTARTMATVIQHSPKYKKNRIYVKEWAGEKLVRNIEVNPKSDRRLIRGKIVHLNRNEFLVVGTYAAPYYQQKFWTRLNHWVFRTRMDGGEQGIYIAKFSYRGEQEYINYYSFTKFANFFEAFGKKEEKKVKKKAKRKEKKGKELVLDFQFLLHDIVELGDQYLFVAESYRPEYRPVYSYDPLTGGSFSRGRQVFAGYRYTHAIVAGIDQKSGRMMWDNSFPIWNILSYNLKERVQVLPSPEDTTVAMVYNYGGALLARTIKEGQVVNSQQIKGMRTEFFTDRVDENYRSDLEYWYDNNFLAWGYQRITNRAEGVFSGKRKRTVFYFYKVSF
ncbi:MAG: hypothetical protein AAF399_21190 [Bacteroidota bacterium]